jgi:hypothetical protein
VTTTAARSARDRIEGSAAPALHAENADTELPIATAHRDKEEPKKARTVVTAAIEAVADQPGENAIID